MATKSFLKGRYAPEGEAAPLGLQAVASGKHGKPETFAYGNRKATGTVTLSGQPSAGNTLTVNGVVFTFVASGATGNQINVGGNQGATTDNIQTVLAASIVTAVTAATYVSDHTGVVTVTYGTNGAAGNAFMLAKVGANLAVSAATLTGGTDANDVSLDTETSNLSTTSGGNQTFVLPNGDDGQDHTLFFLAKGGSSSAVVSGTFVTGTSTAATTATFATAGQLLKLKWLGAGWRVVVNVGTVTLA